MRRMAAAFALLLAVAATAQDRPPDRRIRIRAAGGTIRVSAETGLLTELPAKGGEMVELSVPAGRVKVECLDAGGAVQHSVEYLPDAPAAAPEGGRLGRVQLAHRVYGVFVKLDPGFQPASGEMLVVLRDGQEVARTRILRVCSADRSYPDGAAEIARDTGEIRKGDEVRRAKSP